MTVHGEGKAKLARKHTAIAWIVTVVFILMAFTTLVVVPGRAAAATPMPFRSMRIGVLNLAITTLNPLKITLNDEYVVVYNVYSTLVSYDKHYNPVPDLAKSWSLAPDNVTWTFNLVHDAYFTDPTAPSSQAHPVTAADVVYSYQLQMSTSGSILHSYTQQIASVKALDTYTVQIVTKQPYAAMYSTTSALPILPQYIWSGYTKPLNAPIKYPVGSGPMYYDVTNTTSSVLVLRKNPNYYGLSDYCVEVRPDEVRYISYSDPGQMVTQFTSGADTLDAIISPDPTSYLSPNGLGTWSPKWAVDLGFVGEFSINVITPQIAAQYGYKYTANPVLLNPAFRQAVAMSINKQALVDDALKGLGHVADTLVPDSNPWHFGIPSGQQYQFDPAAARKLLNDAGWAYDVNGNPNVNATPLARQGGQMPLTLRFYTLNTAPEWETAAIDIVKWLAQAGIQTTDKLGNTNPGYGLYSINQMSGYWLSADYDMWLWDWIFTPASDPSVDVLEVETTGAIGPTSDNYYSNATFDGLYNQSLTTVDPVQRRAITDQMQQMIYDYHSYILPYYELQLYAAYTPNQARPTGSLPDPGWSNWGDWVNDPGLTPDSDLPALWYQATPLDYLPPQISSFPQVQWVSGNPATVGVSATDPNGGSLAYTWDFGDGSAVQSSTSSPVLHTYASPGNYTITVRVKNQEWTSCTTTTATIVSGGGPGANLPPILKSLTVQLSHSQYGYVNELVNLTVVANDTEGDPLYLQWDFGDGSATATNYSATNTAQDTTFRQTHRYAANGSFVVNVTVTDNQTGILNHRVSANSTVVIETPPSQTTTVGGNRNPFIDYGVPIVIVLAIVVAVAYVVLRRRKTMKRELGEEERPGTPPGGGSSPPPP